MITYRKELDIVTFPTLSATSIFEEWILDVREGPWAQAAGSSWLLMGILHAVQPAPTCQMGPEDTHLNREDGSFLLPLLSNSPTV